MHYHFFTPFYLHLSIVHSLSLDSQPVCFSFLFILFSSFYFLLFIFFLSFNLQPFPQLPPTLFLCFLLPSCLILLCKVLVRGGLGRTRYRCSFRSQVEKYNICTLKKSKKTKNRMTLGNKLSQNFVYPLHLKMLFA